MQNPYCAIPVVTVGVAAGQIECLNSSCISTKPSLFAPLLKKNSVTYQVRTMPTILLISSF